MRNDVTLKAGEVPNRLTRARAVALSTTGQLPPMKEVALGTQNQKQPLRANSKRAVSDVTYLPHKKRSILQDVTNNRGKNTKWSCINPTAIQVAYIQYQMVLVFVLKCIERFISQ